MKMIPQKWSEVKLKDICTKFLNGGTPSRSEDKYWLGEIPWITGADIVNQKVAQIRRYINQEAIRNSSTNLVEKGNLLVVTRTGVGKIAIAPFDIAISQDLTGIYLDKDRADIHFIFYFFNLRVPRLESLVQGTSINGITRNQLSNQSVFLPPLSEQKKIARILGTWDRAIDLTERLIEAKERRKKGLMQQMLTGKVRFGEFVQSDKMQQSKVGLIPEDWDLKRGDELAIVNPRKETVDNKNLPVSFIPMASVSENARIVGTHIEPYSKVSKGFTSFKDGDIIIAKITPCFENGKGALADNLNNGLGFGSTEFHVMRTKFNVNPHFLFFHTVSYPFRKRGEANMTGSAGQKRVPTDFIKTYRILLPSLPEQRKIAAVLSTCDRETELLREKLDVLREQKKGLMQQLLTGKVRVKI